MTQEAAVPADLWERVRQVAAEEVAKYAQSGPLRNASITGGAGLTVADGGSLQAKAADGTTLFYTGGGTPSLPGGAPQPLTILRRADGSLALAIYDSAPATGGFQQFLALYDRAGNVIVGDDTDSGQGLARPYVPLVFYPAAYTGDTFTVATAFTPVWRSVSYKQHPRLTVAAAAIMTTAGATGEMRLMVNGQQAGPTVTVTSAGSAQVFGPLAVAGEHMSVLGLEVQARCSAAGQQVNVAMQYAHGLQS